MVIQISFLFIHNMLSYSNGNSLDATYKTPKTTIIALSIKTITDT